MPLEAPELDIRKFEDLVREAQLRIPRYAPEWTDYNESDPGITLVQLFVWLTEMMLYQMNRVPERNYLKFLQLLGMELQPAQAATAHLTFTAKPDAAVESVPRRAQLQAQPPEGSPVIFETREGLDLIRPPLVDVQVFDGAAFSVLSAANRTPGTTFPPLGWLPQLGSALYLGFEPPPPDKPVAGRAFPQEMRFRVFLPLAAQAGQPVSCREHQALPAPPVTLVWEYRPASDPTRWRRLSVFKDDSVAFTREGYINVEGPQEIAATVEEKIAEPRYWLRVRLAAGSYPAGQTPVIDFIRPNTVEAESLVTVRDEFVGESEGLPDQVFTLRRAPVQPDSLELVVEQANVEPQTWERVQDFLSSGPEDQHYLLNATRGELTFGDGQRGLIPPAGVEIIARQYLSGGGGAGNVGPGLITTPLTSLVGVDKVTNERPATGGRDEQDVETLKERAPRLLRSRDRAITAEDYAALAAEAGEVRKATAIALAHPDHPGSEVPGAVTVVIVPDAKIEDRAPKPSADLITRVCEYLDARRLLTTELYVKGPEYQAIKIEARVEARAYAAFDTVARNVARAINEYLDPLGRRLEEGAPSGGSSAGWDFGRDFFPTNLFSVILGVADVVSVPYLAVRVDGKPHEVHEPVRVGRDGMLYGSPEHEITVVPTVDL
ncbi:MAG: putative baseplate assembly protein [Acidobacteria bacterium]|nr:putative baseplate assembly protein [Acidobacteriota bacterium]